MRYSRLLESLDVRVPRKDLNVRRYSLSEIISESYKLYYESEEYPNFHTLAEANIEYLKNNPTDLSELSVKVAQLKSLKESISKTNKDIRFHSSPKKRTLRTMKDNTSKESESLTESELQELDAYLQKYEERVLAEGKEDIPQTSWSDLKESLSNYSNKSSKKAFYRTFKKLYPKLVEGTALTRQETFDLYKATNSARTQMSIELEHNPEFLDTFKEAVSLLSDYEESIRESIYKDKGPSKKTLKSLSQFAESIIKEDDDIEDEIIDTSDEEIDIEDTPEDDEVIPEDIPEEELTDEESFDQDYAEAREEVHDQLVAAYGDSEDPAVQDKIDNDAVEVKVLQGMSPEDAAEEVEAEKENPSDEEDIDVEGEVIDTPEEDDITDEEDVEESKIEGLKGDPHGYVAGFVKGAPCWVQSAKGEIVIYNADGDRECVFPTTDAAKDTGYNLLDTDSIKEESTVQEDTPVEEGCTDKESLDEVDDYEITDEELEELKKKLKDMRSHK